MSLKNESLFLSVSVLLALATPARALEPVAMLTSTEGFTPILQSVSVHATWIAGGFPGDADDTGAIYVYRYAAGVWSPSAKLFASVPDRGDRFGQAVAIGEDVLVVGAPNSSLDFGGDAGIAFVFRRDGDQWLQEQVLAPSISDVQDDFGISVAVDGDTIAVGSLGHDEQLGRVFVFRWNGSQWNEEAVLMPSDPPLDSGFGWKTALDGNTIVASAPPDGTPEGQWGSIYVFRRDGGSWTQEAKLVPDQPCTSWCFGGAVAVDGDVLVGVDSGKVAIFRRSLGTWEEEAQVVGTDTVAGDWFGDALALNGTLLAVGAPNADRISLPFAAGSAYLFDYDGVTWTQRTKIVRPLVNADFGSTVALSDTWMVIGTPPSHAGGPTYVYCVAQDAPCIPALSKWAMGVLALGVVVAGAVTLRRRTSRAACLLMLLLPAATLAGDPRLSSPHDPEQLLVRFKRGVEDSCRNSVHQELSAVELRRDRYVDGLTLVRVDPENLSRALAAYSSDPDVLYAEPDYIGHILVEPNDDYFGSQWGMQDTGAGIRGPSAWDLWTGDPQFLIAVLDTGVNRQHEDLIDNIWCNPKECPGVLQTWGWCDADKCAALGDVNSDGCPGDCDVDDDGDGLIDEDSEGREPGDPGYTNDLVEDDDENGYPNDASGWNCAPSQNHPPYDVDGDHGHGTHVSGIIGAVGNNSVGVSGVNWNCKVVVLKINRPENPLNILVSDAKDALDYVIANKIKVSNNSYVWYAFSQSHYDKIEATQSVGHIFVAAAGNKGIDNDSDPSPAYPGSYDLDNIISVAATDDEDDLGDFGGGESSNYGATTVDLGAPGVQILSTMYLDDLYPPADYLAKSGTSMAAPHVTGVVALLRSLNPHWDYQTVKDQLLATVRPVEALDGITVTGGVVNAYAAINDCNLNSIGDDQDVASQTSQDCNDNYWPDECDIASGRSQDCPPNGIPDECEFMGGACCMGQQYCSVTTQSCCENQGGSFPCAGSTCQDSNGNAVADVCESPIGACCVDTTCTVGPQTCCISQGGGFSGEGSTCQDCNGNDVPDACEAGLRACCLPPDGPCVLWTAQCCSDVGGQFFPTVRECSYVDCYVLPYRPTPEP